MLYKGGGGEFLKLFIKLSFLLIFFNLSRLYEYINKIRYLCTFPNFRRHFVNAGIQEMHDSRGEAPARIRHWIYNSIKYYILIQSCRDLTT